MTDGRMLRRGSAVEGGFSYAGAVAALLLVSVVAGLIPAATDFARDMVSYIATVLLQACFLLAAVIPYRSTRSCPKYRLGGAGVKACLAAPAVAAVSLVAFYGLAISFGFFLTAIGYTPSSSSDMTTPYGIAFTVATTIFIAPLCEEMLFRGSHLSSLGVMFGRAEEKKRLILMLCVCGLTFAFIHTRPEQTVYQFFFGATLAFLTIRTGSILPAVIAHAFNNTVGVVLEIPVISAGVDSAVASAGGVWYGVLIFVIVSIALCVGGIFALRAIINGLGKGTPHESFKDADRDSGSVNYADDGGTVAGGVFCVLSFAVCAALWIASLVSGMLA